MELATETVKCTDKIKSLITNLTKEVNTLQDKTTENKLNTLQIRELHEMETEEMVEERLKAFAIPISEVKAILNANEMKSWGKRRRTERMHRAQRRRLRQTAQTLRRRSPRTKLPWRWHDRSCRSARR